MKPSPLACITCEFESIDLADIGISRLLRSIDSADDIRVHRGIPPKHAPDLNRKAFAAQVFYPVTETVLPFLFSGKRNTEPSIEPRQIRSVTTEILCRPSNAQNIAGKLTSLGASHIHIH